MFAFQILPAFKHAFQIGLARAQRQFGLGTGRAGLDQAVSVQRELEGAGQPAGNFQGLVVAPFGQSSGMQGKGHDTAGGNAGRAGQLLAPVARQRQMGSVFQLMHEVIHGKGVGMQGMNPVKVRRLHLAGAAAFAVRGPVEAERAMAIGQGRQFPLAVRADRGGCAAGAAQQAAGGQQAT